MIKSESAIDKAVEYLQHIKPELLGDKPKDIRLETVQLFGKEWVVVLSYGIPQKPSEKSGVLMPPLLGLLSARRYVKEFEIDSETGEVIAMRNPEAPASKGETVPA